jgi:hypothetical protein
MGIQGDQERMNWTGGAMCIPYNEKMLGNRKPQAEKVVTELVKLGVEAQLVEEKTERGGVIWRVMMPFEAFGVGFKVSWSLNNEVQPYWVMEIFDKAGRSCGGTAPLAAGQMVVEAIDSAAPKMSYWKDKTDAVAGMIVETDPADWLGRGGRKGGATASMNAFKAALGERFSHDLESPGGMAAAIGEIDRLLTLKEIAEPEFYGRSL